MIRIEPSRGWFSLKLKDLWEYRDLLYFLVWRDIKALYAQAVLGVGWAVIRPFVSMIIFTVVFGRLAQISSDGVPYAIFNFTALVPWTYFASALTGATESLVAAAAMLTKVYFPRLVIPLTPVLAKLVDFGIGMALLIGLMAWFRLWPTVWIWTLPLLVLLMMFSALGIGLWLTALAVQYRDIRYAAGFGVQLLMYASPVVYPASLVPDKYLFIYGLNPMVGVIEGFRAALLATRPMPWDLIGESAGMSLLLVLSGIWYFQRKERIFADVV